MASLDSVSIAILLGAVLVMAGILSSLLALRFGAPLLLVFLLIGMAASPAPAICNSTMCAPPIWWDRWRWR
jgi:cell volume regulation protein A